MQIPNRMEELSYAYVHAVAARAGMACNRVQPDLDSVEINIKCIDKPATDSLYAPQIELQLKSTEVDLGTEPTFSFPLKMKNYNDLRLPRHIPVLLVLLVLPTNRDHWLEHHEENGLVARRCAYWTNLLGAPQVDNTATRTISVSRTNVFSPEALSEIMIRVSRNQEIGNAL